MYKRLLGPNLVTKVDRLGTYAAALAYFFVLSLVPFLAVTFAVGMEVAVRFDMKAHYETHYAEVVNDIIPGQDPNDTARIFATIERATKGGLITVGFIIAIYTSYNLMDQISRTLLFIFDDPRRPQTWSWFNIVKTVTLLFIWMCLLLLVSISAVEAAILRHFLDHFVLSNWSRNVATASQVLIMIAALFGTVFLTYYVVPARRHKVGVVVEGSLLAACGWIVCSMIFAYIIPKILTTSATYIALGSVVAILLWAQACAWSMILGACWIVRFAPRGK
ncbi:MAG: YihY/virulence factor BrkB family protein [Verrucomicrobiota bacterium]